jgi:non-specific protein-tyrosine kinase
LELKQYLTLLRQWWWLILLLAVLGGGTGFGVNLLIPPVDEASTTILINKAQGALPDAEAVISGQRVAATYAELIRQRPVLEKVIENLKLTINTDTLDEAVQVTPLRDTNLLVLRVKDSNPQRAADIANEIIRVFVEQNMEQQQSSYSASIADIQAQITSLQIDMDSNSNRLKELENAITPAQIAERNRLQELLAQERNTYSNLTQSLGQIQLAQEQNTDKISVVETALLGERVTSQLTLIAIGVFVGIMLAVGLAFLLEYLRDTVNSHEEIDQIIGVPTLGVIGQISGGRNVLITADKPRSPIAEAYRVLRANVEFSAIDGRLQTLLITSSSPSEGKTTTTANLAIASAQAGKHVILVDADLRRPTLHRLFGMENTRGLSAALLQDGGGVIDDHLLPTGIENLSLMPSGPIPPNPADLLGSRRMVELINKLKSKADMIFFDSPPLLAVADSSLLARVCDGAIVVVLTNSTRGEVLRRAADQLEQAGAKLLGVVLNRVSTDGSRYYYYERSYYSSKQ